jgi:hypothetical protein
MSNISQMFRSDRKPALARPTAAMVESGHWLYRGLCGRPLQFGGTSMGDLNARNLKFDRDWLLATFPQLFDSRGDVMSFLTQHVNCEYDPEENVWFMADHRFD